MRIAVEFPRAPHRWGSSAVLDLAQAIEAIGYDEIDVFDQVTVGKPIPGREEGKRAAPELLEPIATLDLLSGGRVRPEVGAGWPRAEHATLGAPFAERGRRMNEAIAVIRRSWTEPSATFAGEFFRAEAMAMDPQPAQPGGPPIWMRGPSFPQAAGAQGERGPSASPRMTRWRRGHDSPRLTQPAWTCYRLAPVLPPGNTRPARRHPEVRHHACYHDLSRTLGGCVSPHVA